MSRSVSILIADDHNTLRELLKDLLNQQPDMKVIAQAGDAEEAVEKAVEMKPDVILMDIDMPGSSPFDAVARISSRCPHTRVIFLTAFVRDRYIEQALAVQAWGYIVKTEPPAAILQAVRSVADDCAYFSSAVQERLVVSSEGTRLVHKDQTLVATLTPREREVLCYLAKGMAKKNMAQVMHVSVKTVEFHCTQLMDKLNIHDRVDLARFAIREGLVEP